MRCRTANTLSATILKGLIAPSYALNNEHLIKEQNRYNIKIDEMGQAAETHEDRCNKDSIKRGLTTCRLIRRLRGLPERRDR